MLEHTPEDVTVAEPLVARTRERRMIRDLVFDRKPTKPTIGEVYLHLTAQRPLRADRKHVADDQHPDHEPRIDRGPTDPGVIGRKLGMDPGQVKNGSNPANGMIVRYRLLKAERIKQLSLFVIEPPHHRPPPQRIASQRANHSTPKPSTTFATKSANSGLMHCSNDARELGYSIASSASASSLSGIVRPSVPPPRR